MSVIFDILPSTSFSDVLTYLSSTGLRIGIHVQGFDSGSSESFVNVPYNPPCIDNDGDGYANPESPNCPNQGLDCDDSNPNVNPGAVEEPYNSEVCSDGLDNDCDGLVDVDDPGCWQCTTPDQCNDGNPCTDDASMGGMSELTHYIVDGLKISPGMAYLLFTGGMVLLGWACYRVLAFFQVFPVESSPTWRGRRRKNG